MNDLELQESIDYWKRRQNRVDRDMTLGRSFTHASRLADAYLAREAKVHADVKALRRQLEDLYGKFTNGCDFNAVRVVESVMDMMDEFETFRGVT